jgi:recombination protein RecA
MGNPSVTTGGNALKFYASQRVEIKRIGSESQGDVRINNVVVAKVVKNKIAPPFLKAEFKITYGKGIDLIEQVISYGEQFNLIEKGGAWYNIPETGQKFNGHKKLYDELASNKELTKNLEEKIYSMVKTSDPLAHSTEIKDVMPEAKDAEAKTMPEEEVDVAQRLIEEEEKESGEVKVSEA